MTEFTFTTNLQSMRHDRAIETDQSEVCVAICVTDEGFIAKIGEIAGVPCDNVPDAFLSAMQADTRLRRNAFWALGEHYQLANRAFVEVERWLLERHRTTFPSQ